MFYSLNRYSSIHRIWCVKTHKKRRQKLISLDLENGVYPIVHSTSIERQNAVIRRFIFPFNYVTLSSDRELIHIDTRTSIFCLISINLSSRMFEREREARKQWRFSFLLENFITLDMYSIYPESKSRSLNNLVPRRKERRHL